MSQLPACLYLRSYFLILTLWSSGLNEFWSGRASFQSFSRQYFVGGYSRPVLSPLSLYRIEILVTGLALNLSWYRLQKISWDRDSVLSPVSNDVPLIDSLSYIWLGCTTLHATLARPVSVNYFSYQSPSFSCWMQAMNKCINAICFNTFPDPPYTAGPGSVFLVLPPGRVLRWLEV